MTPDWKRRSQRNRRKERWGLTPKPAIGSSTIMVIFLGPPADKHTGTENPDRTNKIREREKRERKKTQTNPVTFTWQKW